MAASLSGLTRWILAGRSDVPPAISATLTSGLYSSIPIFLGGVLNSTVVAAIAVSRHPTASFILWLAIELALGFGRLPVVIAGARARARGEIPPMSVAVPLSCAWAASVGYGAFISIGSGDWVLASIVCLSTTGMVAGICLRNFGTPRLVMLMMLLCLVPCAVAALFSSEVVLVVIAIQLPIYMVVIGSAAFRLYAMMLGHMVTQHALEKSEAFNRSILDSSPDYTLLLCENGKITFCNRPNAGSSGTESIIGTLWLDMLPAKRRIEGQHTLEKAASGQIARLSVPYDGLGGRRWFDLAVSPVADGSGRTLIVARDITVQKASEERALWMANHDPLTGLPNRLVLQSHLESLSVTEGQEQSFALLVLDIDNFKMINDTLGHDAGDALLCDFAQRLRSAVRDEDLIARLGGDEFALVLRARTGGDVEATAAKIFGQLGTPFVHDGRLLECNASIGAAFYPRDGAHRSELMKAADIALYSAKSSGRGQLKIFRSAMRDAFQDRNSMIFLARSALATDQVLPYYQPKVDMGTGAILGFEALLRWRDAKGVLCLPGRIAAAFEEPALSAAISERMLSRTIADIRCWLDAGVDFGHVAINVAASEFRSGRFSQDLLARLAAAEIPLQCVQIEVTETVFLGRSADYVQQALRQLSRAGVRIALDDFGTGYAALTHLMQFPVDALKIDKSFIKAIGRNDEAEAIIKAIINLASSLGIEIIAEGIETAEQEAHLLGLGCRNGQGYLYSKAIASEAVPRMVARQTVTAPLANSG